MDMLAYFRNEVALLKSKLEADDRLIWENQIPAIEALIESFNKEGHSGVSAGFAGPSIADAIKKNTSF